MDENLHSLIMHKITNVTDPGTLHFNISHNLTKFTSNIFRQVSKETHYYLSSSNLHSSLPVKGHMTSVTDLRGALHQSLNKKSRCNTVMSYSQNLVWKTENNSLGSSFWYQWYESTLSYPICTWLIWNHNDFTAFPKICCCSKTVLQIRFL